MDLVKECMGARRIGISAHARPDGDATGSSMALYLYLKKVLPQAQVTLYLEQVPASLSHLPHLDEVDGSFISGEDFDVFFALDTVPERMGGASALYDRAKKKINIDHHVSNVKGCGDVNLVIPTASSTAEVIYGILDGQYMDAEIAVCIYTGIIHDTGVMQYSNTTPKTLRIVADLISYGFDFPKIVEESFYQRTHLQALILGYVLQGSISLLDGRCIVGCIDKKKMDSLGACSADLDGIVNQLRNIKGADCAFFMHEVEAGEYRVSIRGSEKVDVARVAVAFGGGGHVRASGCTVKGTAKEVRDKLIGEIARQLEAGNV